MTLPCRPGRIREGGENRRAGLFRLTKADREDETVGAPSSRGRVCGETKQPVLQQERHDQRREQRDQQDYKHAPVHAPAVPHEERQPVTGRAEQEAQDTDSCARPLQATSTTVILDAARRRRSAATR